MPSKYANRGIGKLLVKSAEAHLLAVKDSMISENPESQIVKIVMEMGVINQRTDLFPWYERQGYLSVGPLPHDAELARIVLDGVDVYCVLMRKVLWEK